MIKIKMLALILFCATYNIKIYAQPKSETYQVLNTTIARDNQIGKKENSNGIFLFNYANQIISLGAPNNGEFITIERFTYSSIENKSNNEYFQQIFYGYDSDNISIKVTSSKYYDDENYVIIVSYTNTTPRLSLIFECRPL